MKSPFIKRKPTEPPQPGSIFRKRSAISGAPAVVDSKTERAGHLIGKLTLSFVQSLHYVVLPLIYLSYFWCERAEFLELLPTGFWLCLSLALPIVFARFIANTATSKEDDCSYKAIGVHLIGTTVHSMISLTLYLALS